MSWSRTTCLLAVAALFLAISSSPALAADLPPATPAASATVLTGDNSSATVAAGPAQVGAAVPVAPAPVAEAVGAAPAAPEPVRPSVQGEPVGSATDAAKRAAAVVPVSPRPMEVAPARPSETAPPAAAQPAPRAGSPRRVGSAAPVFAELTRGGNLGAEQAFLEASRFDPTFAVIPDAAPTALPLATGVAGDGSNRDAPPWPGRPHVPAGAAAAAGAVSAFLLVLALAAWFFAPAVPGFSAPLRLAPGLMRQRLFTSLLERPG